MELDCAIDTGEDCDTLSQIWSASHTSAALHRCFGGVPDRGRVVERVVAAKFPWRDFRYSRLSNTVAMGATWLEAITCAIL